MTDRERLLELLASFNITPVTVEQPEKLPSLLPTPAPGDVILGAGNGGVDGYGGFVCIFSFKPDGSFENVGVWE